MKRRLHRVPPRPALVLSAALLLGTLAATATCVAASEGKSRPVERAIAVAPEFTGVIVPRGEDVSVDLVLENRGPVSESILVSLPEVPPDWDAVIRTYAYRVTGARVTAGETRTLTLKLVPGEAVTPGRYAFPMEARTEDGALTATARLNVTVTGEQKTVEHEGVRLATSYPVLQGPTGAEFEFSLDVENELDKDATFSLTAQGPENWEVRFKPAYEDKVISSLHIKAGQSRSMAVAVKPHTAAEPGEYPIRVRAVSEGTRTEADLVVVLTGTHKIDLGTADGRLSLSAGQGRASTLSFFVENTGSAVQRDLRFLSFKPENWDVTFEPESIEVLEPGDVRQVDATVTPSEQALVGDYSVSLSVQGEKVSKGMELRVTVKASTAWGWVGIGVILLVIAGLVFLFVRVGRR